MKQLKLFAFLFLLVVSGTAYGQGVVCPPNVDFEQGTFSGWYLYTGSCCPIVTGTAGLVAGRHTITSGTGTDPYGNFPVVSPGGGTRSLKLGNSSTSSQAERARYYVRVPNNQNNYSLILRYAVVLQNPTHTASEQPRFEVRAFDSLSNVALPCVQFSFVASSSLPGFVLSNNGSDVYYKSWSTASINLSGKAGRTVAIDIASGDCDQGGHFGYGYVDLNCGLFQISSLACKGNPTTPLTAPPGFQTYRWYDSTFTTLLGTSQTTNVTTPAVYNKYHVVISPYSGYGCPDTLTTTITVSDVNLRLDKDTVVCSGASVQLRDSVSANPIFFPLTYQWTPSTGLSCSNCLSPVVTPVADIKYKLKATDVTGCIVTDSIQLSIDRIIDQPADRLLCSKGQAVFALKMLGNSNYTYQWRKDTVIIPGATNDSLVISNLSYNDTARYDVIINNGCSTYTATPAKLNLFYVRMSAQPQSILACKNSSAVLRSKIITNEPVVQYQWNRNGFPLPGTNSDSLLIPALAYADSGFYTLTAKGNCDSTVSDTARIEIKRLQVTDQFQLAAICENGSAMFHVTPVGPDLFYYQWKKDGTLIPGATDDTLNISSLALSDSGIYHVVVTNSCDTVDFVHTRLNVKKATSIVPHSLRTNTCFGNTAVLKITALGEPPLNYQWAKDGFPIGAATTDQFVMNNVSYNDTGLYKVVVAGQCGIDSSTERLTVYPSTLITSHPVGVSKCHHASNMFTVTASGVPDMRFQWHRNMVKIPGAVNDTFILQDITSIDSLANFSVMVYGGCDSVLSVQAKVIVHPEPQPGLPDTTKLCIKTGKLGSAGFSQYLWSNGSTSDSSAITADGTYWLRVVDNNLCVNYDTTFVRLIQTALVDAGPDTVLCNELPLQLNGYALHHDSVQWVENPSGFFGSPSDLSPVFNVNPGTVGYTPVVLSVYSYCGLETDELVVDYKPKVSSEFDLSDSIVCINSPAISLLPHSSGGTFSGNAFMIANSFDPVKIGVHPVIHRVAQYGCSDTTKHHIRVIEYPKADFISMPAKPSLDSAVRFVSTSKDAKTFLWDFGNGDYSSEKNPSYLYNKEGEYRISLIALNEKCVDTTEQKIKVNGMGAIWVPSAFSPNGDGVNDVFSFVYKNSKYAVVRIYTRWGQKVYESDDPSKGWDGTNNGSPCTVDTYIFVIEYMNNNDEMVYEKGQLTLIR